MTLTVDALRALLQERDSHQSTSQRHDAVLRGDGGIALSGITHDSRAVANGTMFCCVPGARHDGHDFAARAVTEGASALLVERWLELDVPQLRVASVRTSMGPAAAAVFGEPSRRLDVIGVTGTNGKTSVVHLLAHTLQHLGVATASIGTLSGARTTPEAPDLQKQLAELAAGPTRAVAMEVSSHALDLHRVDGTMFRMAVFTNLGHDHLDFHETMEQYFEAKAQLFVERFTDLGIVNRDDPYGRRLIDAAPVPITSFGTEDAIDLSVDGPMSTFRWEGHEVVLRLAGEHNVSNALAAATVARELGHDPAAIADALCAAGPPRGRFEFVNVGQDFHVIVDYAHKPEALRAVLESARQVAGTRRVILVVGCGGDRDREKRPMMGAVAGDGADVVILTSDNPRSEDPAEIIAAIERGVTRREKISVVEDRRDAIGTAVAVATPGDVVLIAGKGHEDYQEVMGETIAFDDRLVAIEAITSSGGGDR